MKPSEKFPGGLELESTAEVLVAKQAHDEMMALAGFKRSILSPVFVVGVALMNSVTPVQSDKAGFSANLRPDQADLMLECLRQAQRLSTDPLLVNAVTDMLDGYQEVAPEQDTPQN